MGSPGNRAAHSAIGTTSPSIESKDALYERALLLQNSSYHYQQPHQPHKRSCKDEDEYPDFPFGAFHITHIIHCATLALIKRHWRKPKVTA